MRYSYIFMLSFAFAIDTVAFPSRPAEVSARDVHDPIINASVTDHGGLDITSAFQVMVYEEPEIEATVSNLTDRRRQPAVLSRPIIDCPTPNSVFVDSICTYEDGKPFGMQSWELSCYVLMNIPHPTAGYQQNFPILTTRAGHCGYDEICVDGLGRGGGSRHGQHSVASCVSTQYFVRMIDNARKSADQRSSLTGLENKQVRMMASKPDGSTPMEVDTLNVTAVDNAGNAIRSDKCRDCTELKADTLGSTADGLRAQVRLLTTGAAAGILWLAIVSG